MGKNPIKLENCPKNDMVSFYYPDGSLITMTDNDLVFLYIRSEIKRLGLYGCYISYKDQIIRINENGDLSDYPKGLFDAWGNLQITLL